MALLAHGRIKCGEETTMGKEEDTVKLSSPTEGGETPMNRIRVKTTVVLTTSDRINWRDDLF